MTFPIADQHCLHNIGLGLILRIIFNSQVTNFNLIIDFRMEHTGRGGWLEINFLIE